jgi:predicted nucleic acid-binding protein
MRPVVFDTDLYIDWIEAGLHEELILGRAILRHMSTVVLMELQAGATSRASADAVGELFQVFRKNGRLLVPSAETYWRAGSVLRALQARHKITPQKRYRLGNDCLIALSTHQIGATLLSRNARDFRLIQEIEPFPLIIVP